MGNSVGAEPLDGGTPSEYEEACETTASLGRECDGLSAVVSGSSTDEGNNLPQKTGRMANTHWPNNELAHHGETQKKASAFANEIKTLCEVAKLDLIGENILICSLKGENYPVTQVSCTEGKFRGVRCLVCCPSAEDNCGVCEKISYCSASSIIISGFPACNIGSDPEFYVRPASNSCQRECSCDNTCANKSVAAVTFKTSLSSPRSVLAVSWYYYTSVYVLSLGVESSLKLQKLEHTVTEQKGHGKCGACLWDFVNYGQILPRAQQLYQNTGPFFILIAGGLMCNTKQADISNVFTTITGISSYLTDYKANCCASSGESMCDKHRETLTLSMDRAIRHIVMANEESRKDLETLRALLNDSVLWLCFVPEAVNKELAPKPTPHECDCGDKVTNDTLAMGQ